MAAAARAAAATVAAAATAGQPPCRPPWAHHCPRRATCRRLGLARMRGRLATVCARAGSRRPAIVSIATVMRR
eukprot:scaffold53811_cov58-Phaeocystis_antarctica.AAC.1